MGVFSQCPCRRRHIDQGQFCSAKKGQKKRSRCHSTALSFYVFGSQRKLYIVPGFHKSKSASISRCASIRLIRPTDKGRPSSGSIELENEFKLKFKELVMPKLSFFNILLLLLFEMDDRSSSHEHSIHHTAYPTQGTIARSKSEHTISGVQSVCIPRPLDRHRLALAE